MSWQISQIAKDAITPLFDSSSQSTSSNILDFFLPKSRQGSIQPQGIKRFFSGWSQTQTPNGGAIQIMDTVQNLMKGLHAIVQVISGVGNQISVLVKNTTNKKIDLGTGHHIFRGVLKTVFKVLPVIVTLAAIQDTQDKKTNCIINKKINFNDFLNVDQSKDKRKKSLFGKYKSIKKGNIFDKRTKSKCNNFT